MTLIKVNKLVKAILCHVLINIGEKARVISCFIETFDNAYQLLTKHLGHAEFHWCVQTHTGRDEVCISRMVNFREMVSFEVVQCLGNLVCIRIFFDRGALR